MSNSGVYRCMREAVRVKVKNYENSLKPEYRKFSIDPQITSFADLQSIIAKAFDIKGEFIIKYKTLTDYSQETMLPLLSDLDLEAAVLSASDVSDPCLLLQVEVKPSCEKEENWHSVIKISEQPPLSSPLHRNVFGTIEIPRNQSAEIKFQKKLPGLIMNRMEKTLNIFQKAFNLGEDQVSNPSVQSSTRPPLSEAEYKKFLDQRGQINQMEEFRLAIYYGGVEPSFRKVVWKHILNVYPEGMTGSERIEYMKKKSNEYDTLKNTWRDILQKNQMNEELTYVTSMVRKDVLRTDRHHKFYAGSDDNQNIASLFNILTTYALNHPSVSYCQGMSDLASPLLVTMGDEAQAYICFCALMSRLKPNFMLDGITMTLKFQHLTEGLTYYDPEFYAYLKLHQAEDLLFCYRWLLLEMKREFAFDDALRMLEVLWSSMPAVPPEKELPLYEIKFSPHSNNLTPPPFSPLIKNPRESHFAKVCALRRQSSLMSLNSKRIFPGTNRSSGQSLEETILVRQNQSLDETILARQNQIRKHRNVKPFSSLDDNCVQFLNTISINASRSISPMSVRSESDVLTFMKKRAGTMRLSNRKGGLSSSTGSLMETSNKKKLHKRLAENKSFNSLSETGSDENYSSKTNWGHKGKIVKNLNEFLNLTMPGKTRVLNDRFIKPQNCSVSDGETGVKPEIAVTKSLTDEVTSNPVHCDLDNISELQISTSSSCTSSASRHLFENHPSEVSSPDDSNGYYPMTGMSMAKELELELDELDRKLFGPGLIATSPSFPLRSNLPGVIKSENNVEPEIFIWGNSLKSVQTPDEQAELEFDSNTSSGKSGETTEIILNPSETFPNKSNQNGFSNDCERGAESTGLFARSANSIRVSGILNSLRSGVAVTQILRSSARSQTAMQLPKPEEFGGGNPFLMFLCLTLLRQHRDYIIQSAMDYNEMAMHFDKMVRKHNVTKVLDEARQLFSSYLKQHSIQEEECLKPNVRT